MITGACRKITAKGLVGLDEGTRAARLIANGGQGGDYLRFVRETGAPDKPTRILQ